MCVHEGGGGGYLCFQSGPHPFGQSDQDEHLTDMIKDFPGIGRSGYQLSKRDGHSLDHNEGIVYPTCMLRYSPGDGRPSGANQNVFMWEGCKTIQLHKWVISPLATGTEVAILLVCLGISYGVASLGWPAWLSTCPKECLPPWPQRKRTSVLQMCFEIPRKTAGPQAHQSELCWDVTSIPQT